MDPSAVSVIQGTSAGPPEYLAKHVIRHDGASGVREVCIQPPSKVSQRAAMEEGHESHESMREDVLSRGRGSRVAAHTGA